MFQPGGGNGRPLDDDSFDIAVQFLAGSRLGSASTPRAATTEFPYLSAPVPADLPALAELFGLRGQRPEQTPPADSLVPERDARLAAPDGSGLPAGARLTDHVRLADHTTR